MENTKKAIIDASDLPLSIIIVGVGDEDFSQMEEFLNKQKLRVLVIEGNRKEAKRDIVQFVKMKHVEGEDGEVVASKEELAREALKKIPSQVEKYKCLIDKKRLQHHAPL